jgi:hypothetical protein
MSNWVIGDVIHGFCGGYFGRDSYQCRMVEAVGPDWIVTRNERGTAEFLTGTKTLRSIVEYADDRTWCHSNCTGPEEARIVRYAQWRGAISRSEVS